MVGVWGRAVGGGGTEGEWEVEGRKGLGDARDGAAREGLGVPRGVVAWECSGEQRDAAAQSGVADERQGEAW